MNKILFRNGILNMKSKIIDTTWQFLKYCISGGIGAGIDFSLFSLLVTFFHIEYLISNVISFSLGTIVVCYMQKNWTFQYSSNDKAQLYSKYLLSIGIIFLLNTLLLIFFVEQFHFGEIPAKFSQVILSSVIGYLVQKSFVFTERKFPVPKKKN